MAQHGRNRSDRLQLYLAGNIVLVAMREISPGGDLTTDYTIFDDFDGEMDCRCDSASCRGKISGRDWQRPELQRKIRGRLLCLWRRIQHIGDIHKIGETHSHGSRI
jgi:hypothetical protein